MQYERCCYELCSERKNRFSSWLCSSSQNKWWISAFFLMFYSYLLYFLNIIEGNAITVVRKMFPQLLTEVFQKALACRLPNQSLKSFFFFRTCYLKRQEIKVFRCFLRAKCVNIARNVVLVLPCFCSFNLYNFVRKVDFFSTFG